MAKRQTTIVKAASTIGSTLGHITVRVEALNRERQALAQHLRDVVASAQKALEDLGHDVGAARTAFLTARRRGGRPKGYTMSEETRAKLRAAWARRKAAAGTAVKKEIKAVKKGVRTMSAEARARISAAQKARWAKVKRTR